MDSPAGYDLLHLSPPGRPTPEQERAVARADARARELLVVPDYRLHWVRAPWKRALACTRFAPSPAVWIRDDLPPERCYSAMLHELQHVADSDIITELSEAESERRAEAFVQRAMRGEPTMATCEGCGFKLHNRSRFHDACAAKARSAGATLTTQGTNGYTATAPATTRQRLRACSLCGGFLIRENESQSTCANGRCGRRWWG
jgi:hypothetical protein